MMVFIVGAKKTGFYEIAEMCSQAAKVFCQKETHTEREEEHERDKE